MNYKGETVVYTVLESVQYASMGLVLTSILILLKKGLWKYFFLGLILLSFIGLLDFYNQTFSIEIGVFSIDITAFVLLCFHLALNPDILSKIKLKMQPSMESIKKKEEMEEKLFEKDVNHFMKKFSLKQKNELERMVNDGALTPVAVEAARRLLNQALEGKETQN